MIQTTREALKAKIEELLELGLDNKRIAERLNEEYGATNKNSLSAMAVSKLRKTLNIEKRKAQKEALFEFVEEKNIVPPLVYTRPFVGTDGTAGAPMPYKTLTSQSEMVGVEQF
jgi:hypothetical protein